MKKSKGIPLILLAMGLALAAKEKRLENTSGLWDVRVLAKVGFIDASGRLVIPARFDESGFFSESLCAVRQGAMWGYIDVSGRLVLPARFDRAGHFSEGWAVVGVAGRKSFIDRTGRSLPVPAVEEAGPFQESRARVKTAGRWGYIDPQGRRVIPAQFEAAGDFFEGLAAVSVRGKWGYIDRDGRPAIQPRFLEASDFQEGRAVVRSPTGLRYIDSRGNDLFAGRNFQEAQVFSGGLAAVRMPPSGRFGYIDASGTFIIQPRYDDALPFNEGLAAVRQRERWGFIDTQGRTVVDFRYERADFFINGLARVSLMGRECYVDLQGRLVWEPGGSALPPSLRKLPQRPASAEAVVIHYNMGGLTDILVQEGKVVYRSSRYKGQNPVAAGHLDDYEFFTETADVSAGEEKELLLVFEKNGFERLQNEYGALEPGARYYGVTFRLKSESLDKTVLFKSSPQTDMPAALREIEQALFDLTRKKFEK